MSITTPAARTAPAGLAARLPQRITKATLALAVASLAAALPALGLALMCKTLLILLLFRYFPPSMLPGCSFPL